MFNRIIFELNGNRRYFSNSKTLITLSIKTPSNQIELHKVFDNIINFNKKLTASAMLTENFYRE
jgi:hypothetical protein